MSLGKPEQKKVMEALRGAGTCSGVEPDAPDMPEALREYHPKIGDGVAFFYKESGDGYIGKLIVTSSWGARVELERLNFEATESNPPTVHAKFSKKLEVGDFEATDVTIVSKDGESVGHLTWIANNSGGEDRKTLWKWPPHSSD